MMSLAVLSGSLKMPMYQPHQGGDIGISHIPIQVAIDHNLIDISESSKYP